jgi:hypothetical protein
MFWLLHLSGEHWGCPFSHQGLCVLGTSFSSTEFFPLIFFVIILFSFISSQKACGYYEQDSGKFLGEGTPTMG